MSQALLPLYEMRLSRRTNLGYPFFPFIPLLQLSKKRDIANQVRSAAASKTMWRKFESKLSQVYSKKVFWTASYFIASCGGVTIEKLKQYVQNQDSPA